MTEDKLSYEINHARRRLEVSGDENKFGKIMKKFEGCRKNNQKRNSWIVVNLDLEDALKKFIDDINGSSEETAKPKPIAEPPKNSAPQPQKEESEAEESSESESEESSSEEEDDEEDQKPPAQSVKKFTPVKAVKKSITPPQKPAQKKKELSQKPAASSTSRQRSDSPLPPTRKPLQKKMDDSPPPPTRKPLQKQRDDSPPPPTRKPLQKQRDDSPPPPTRKPLQKQRDDSPPPPTRKPLQKQRDDSPPHSKKISNSPTSRKQLFNKKFSPEYSTRYSSDKISYYKSLGKKHVSDVDDSSTDYSSSSDSDFPSPEPVKKRGGKRLEEEEDVEELKKKIRDLEKKKR